MTTRILQIIPTLDRGGAEKQLALLATNLPRSEFEVHVCALTRCGPWADALQSRDIPLHQIRKRLKVDPAAYWRLKRLIRRLRPQLVHTWLFAANCYGRQAAFAAGVPHVVAGERCVDRWKVWHELAIDRYLVRRTERIATNSRGVQDFYVQQRLPADKFVVIPNGIDAVTDQTVSRAQLLDELELPKHARLIGAVGRLWPQKRYKDMIWSAELLRTIHPEIHLLIVGDGPLRWRLQRYRDQVGVSGNVHLLGHRDDVSALLPHLDCFWLASGCEGQSNALMEAMLAGVPVVATDIIGNRELVVPQQTGYLVPVGDRAGLARWTSVLLEQPELARRMGEAGRQRMLNEFSVARMVQRYAELYNELLNA